MSAENIQHRLSQFFGVWVLGVSRQMEKFVGSTHPHRVGFMPQVFNGVFQALLPLALFGVSVGFCLFFGCSGLCFCSVGLCLCGVLHRLGAPVGNHGLQGNQHATHADANKLQNVVL